MNRDIKFVLNHFDKIRETLNPISESDEDSSERYSEKTKTVPNLNGQNLLWRTPDVFWVNAYEYVESYEASALQIGIARNGDVVYETQSHCSCMGWSNSELSETKKLESITDLIDILKHDFDREAIVKGNTPTLMTEVKPRFYETLTALLTIYKNSAINVKEGIKE